MVATDLVAPDGGSDLTITFLDVGQGDCIVVNCANGFNFMVDCGSVAGGDANMTRDRVASLLGDQDLDLLVVTHPDADHLNYIPRVIADRRIGRAMLGGDEQQHYRNHLTTPAGNLSRVGQLFQLLEGDADHEPRAELVEFASDEDAWPSAPGVPDERFQCGDTSVFVLAASEVTQENSGGEPNYSGSDGRNTPSIVLMLERSGYRVLLTGDATHTTENAIIARYADTPAFLDVNVLKVGHHGSHHSTVEHENDPSWLDATRPEYAIISHGDHGGFRHPRCVVLEALDTTSSMRQTPMPGVLRCGEGNRQWGERTLSHAIWSTGFGETRIRIDSRGRALIDRPSDVQP